MGFEMLSSTVTLCWSLSARMIRGVHLLEFPPIDALRFQLFARLSAATAGRTARAKLDNETEQTETCTNPHEHQHLSADVSVDIQTGIGVGEDVCEDFEHDSCYGRCDDRDESSEEG